MTTSNPAGVVVPEGRRPTVEPPDRALDGAPSSTVDLRIAGMQREANDRVWEHGRNLEVYANRQLRPVEVDILVRFRESLSGHVIELGSGAGRLTGYLAEISASVEGIDLSEEMVAYSRRRYPKASFAQGDLRDASVLGAAPYDAIILAFNIVDVLSDADRHVLLDRLHGALSADGIVVMSSHNRAFAPHLTDPLRLVGMSRAEAAWSLVRLPRWWWNRRRLLRFERREPTYAILNDVGHDYSVLHYYITRDAQVRQFEAHGFEVLEVLDLEGVPVGPGELVAECPELHYVVRRAA